MISKKANAIITLLTALMYTDHQIFTSIHLMTDNTDASMPEPAIVLSVLVALHAVIASINVFIGHDGASPRHMEFNKGTIVQRVSAALLMAIIPLHIMTSQMLPDKGIFPAFLAAHFLLVVFAGIHLAVSLPKAFITLGWVSSVKLYKLIRVICYVAYGVMGLLALVACVLAVKFV